MPVCVRACVCVRVYTINCHQEVLNQIEVGKPAVLAQPSVQDPLPTLDECTPSYNYHYCTQHEH